MATYIQKTWTEQNKLINFYKQLITSKNMCSDVSKCRIHNCFHYFSLLITKKLDINWKSAIFNLFCFILPFFFANVSFYYLQVLYNFYLRLIIHYRAFLYAFSD